MTRQLGSILLAATLAAATACGDDDSDDKDASQEPSTGVCGDGTIDEGEKCDDGNQASGDGCSSSCNKETGDAGRADAGALDAGSRDGGGERDSGGELDSGQRDTGTSIDAGGSTKPDAGNTTDASGGDAGGGGGSDAGAGSGGDAGAGGGDAGSATTDGGSEPEVADLCTREPASECERCSCTECATEMAACRDVEGVAAAGAGAGKTKSALCQAVVVCGQENGCRGEACFCGLTAADGGVDLVGCLTGAGPQGPCKDEIFAAAETDDPTMVATRRSDQNFALVFANNVSTCSTGSCSAACTQ